MTSIRISCFHCKKKLLRRAGWINENKKLGHKHYCSFKCMGNNRKLRKTLTCENPRCKKKFERRVKEIFPHSYCSRSCAVIVNNTKYPKNPGVIKRCKYCNKEFISKEKYCSRRCKDKEMIISKKEILKCIGKFNKENKRIPLKREFNHYHAARGRFGTWNNAIKAAGLKPNPVMFAKKHVANDGHKCDSLAEKIIDDWLYARKINHKINASYPGNYKLTVDFVIGDYWIEFFGLSGGHKRYDELKEKKLELVKKHKIKFVAIYPKHLFPKNMLSEILAVVLNQETVVSSTE